MHDEATTRLGDWLDSIVDQRGRGGMWLQSAVHTIIAARTAGCTRQFQGPARK
jgi:hypothetical protein